MAKRTQVTFGDLLIANGTNVDRYLITSVKSWRREADRLQKEAHVFYFACKHSRVRWYAKLVAAGTAAYLLSPVQLIPSFIPMIGFLDDLLVLVVAIKLLRRIIPSDVLAECRQLAEAAQMRRKETWSSLAVVGFFAIASLWLLAAITASALIAAYIHR
jgi:uncharacterized membrane protein YkvA (DUF1232 family)